MDHPDEGGAPGAHAISVELRDGRKISMSFIGIDTKGEPPLVILTEEPR